MAIISCMGQRDHVVVSLARVKRKMAKAERKLARWRTKESFLLHRLQSVNEDLAEKRLTQADINLERAMHHQKQEAEKARVNVVPVDIITSM